MSDSLPQQAYQCPQCGARLSASQRCWLCQSEVPRTEAEPGNKPISPAPAIAPIQFGLDSILLLMTFVAVLSGLFAIAPGIAVVGAVLSLPALIRTAILARQKRVAGAPMGWGIKTITFLATTSFVVVLLTAMGAAFYATCWIGFWGGAFGHGAIDPGVGFDTLATGFFVGIPLGIIAALFVMGWMLRRVLKKDYRIPAWAGWFGFVVALGGMLLYWIFHSRDMEVISFTGSVSAIGLIFSMLGLGTPKRWACAWGTGLGAGPLISSLLVVVLSHEWSWLDSILSAIMASFIALVIGGALHLWVMDLEIPTDDEQTSAKSPTRPVA